MQSHEVLREAADKVGVKKLAAELKLSPALVYKWCEEAQPDDPDASAMARRHTEVFLEVIGGEGFAEPNPHPMFPNPPGLLRIEPFSEGLRDRIWWGAASNATAEWAASRGMNLMSSTLKTDESGKPFHVQQAERSTPTARRGPTPAGTASRACR